MKLSLVNPTAETLIAILSQLDPQTPVRIEDPDTSWTISIFHMHADEGGKFWITGEYREMEKT